MVTSIKRIVIVCFYYRKLQVCTRIMRNEQVISSCYVQRIIDYRQSTVPFRKQSVSDYLFC